MNQPKKFPLLFTVIAVAAALSAPVWFSACNTAAPASAPKEETPPPQNAAEAQAEEIPPPEKENAQSGQEGDYAETRPGSEKRDEMTVVFSSGELELDFRKSFIAGEAQIFTALYEGLFSYNPVTMNPMPAAASKWEVSEDKKTWTFTIRDRARFANGDPIRAEDFRAAWLSLLAPEMNAPYSSLFDIIEGAREYRTGAGTAGKVGITAVNQKTLVVKLNSPAAFFPSMLCHHSFSPIHPSMLNADNWTRPVSNGPFFIEEMDTARVILVKNPHYWDAGRVELNKINVKFSDDADEAAALWNSGEARWIHSDVNTEALTDRSGIEVNAMFATHYYFVRSARKPWNDHRLRRALSLVLPWDEIRALHVLPAKTLIYPIPGYPEIGGIEETNAAEAERLMAEAGFPKGAGLPELVIRITPGPDAERVAGLMAHAWYSLLGIPVKIDVVSYRRYFEALKQDDYDVGSTTWIGDFADPYTFLQMWCRDSNLNDAKHSDEDFEALIGRSMAEEGEKRWSTLAEAEKLLLERGNVLPVSFSPAFNIIDLNEIDGWYPNVLDIHPFKYMEIKARRPLPNVAMAKSRAEARP